jgi:hypothetical protein
MERFCFPVQLAVRPDANFRGFAGTIAEGWVAAGDAVRVTASGETARVQRIVTMDGDLPRAEQGQAVTLTLDREVDVSRGDVISCSQAIDTTDQFEATLVWMHQDAGLTGRSYMLKLATQITPASITGIKHGINVNTLANEPRSALALNDISVCTLATGKAVAFGEALSPEFRTYAAQVVANARAMAAACRAAGLDVVSGGTDTHVALIDLRPMNVTGKDAEAALERAYITCNKNGIPFDPAPPTITSGIRVGSPAGTTRGFGEEEFRQIGAWIGEIVAALSAGNSEAVENKVRAEVKALTAQYPIYQGLGA